MMKSDIEISNEKKLIKIDTILKKYGLRNKDIINYGNYKAKIDLNFEKSLTRKAGKLILVTSINPTPYGEGKTTMAIGLTDALCELGKKAIVCLREPSLGPVFGIKGGATGGGYSQVVPMEDINLHFTGDMHAITSANNLLCAIVDNHIFQGNELKIKDVIITRCLDINDRALRNVTISEETKPRKEHFCISVATEIMAILCLSKDFKDLKERLSQIIVGYNEVDEAIKVKDLQATDALAILLKDAINPNAVQTLEGNLALIHGGPFANIAHGCNSIIATNLALKMADYVVTEAGFGADLGAEKFLDITCPTGNFKPSTIVINVTVRSIKHNGGCLDMNDHNLKFMKQGICNLECHLTNMQKYTKNVLVCINKFITDTKEEINYIEKYCQERKVLCSVSETFAKGSNGGLDLANKVLEVSNKDNDYHKLYNDNIDIKDKIFKVATEIYHAKSVIYSKEAEISLKRLGKDCLNYPVCIAKTQYSISDNKDILGYPRDYEVHVREIYVCNGAKFIVVMMGSILRMPGLSKHPAYIDMTINEDKIIRGLY